VGLIGLEAAHLVFFHMYYVYAIYSLHRNYIYVGLTNDITRRVAEHNNGYNKTTKPYLPFKTLRVEVFPNRPEARKREKYLKSGVGKQFLKSLATATLLL